jgi:hypothetical protein
MEDEEMTIRNIASQRDDQYEGSGENGRIPICRFSNMSSMNFMYLFIMRFQKILSISAS